MPTNGQFSGFDEFTAWNERMSERCDPGEYFRTKNLPVRWIENARLRAVLRAADTRDTDRVLDIGCGTGEMLLLMKGMRTGVDLSTSMLKRARAALPPHIQLVEAPAERLPFPSRSFDKITCSEVIEHVMDPRAVLEEMKRVLKDDGTAVVSIPNEKMIIRLKDFFHRIGLSKLFFCLGKQTMSLRNDWHLHDASRELFEEWNDGIFGVESVRPVPSGVFPVRYVFRLKKNGSNQADQQSK